MTSTGFIGGCLGLLTLRTFSRVIVFSFLCHTQLLEMRLSVIPKVTTLGPQKVTKSCGPRLKKRVYQVVVTAVW